MPEGDILRRTALTLDRALTGSVVTAAELRWPTVAQVHLVGRTVLGTRSYGKHLFTRFDDGRTLHSHLRMEGSWRLERTPDREGQPSGSSQTWARPRGPFVRAVISTAAWTAVGDRLGMVDVVPTRGEHGLIAHLGPDILAEDFPTVGLTKALQSYAERGALPVAEVLLDQRVLAGIGTIYMAESLHARRIWPWTPADAVEDPASLLMTARVLMERSVEAQTTDSPTTADRWLVRSVHGRRGRPCPRCSAPVARGEVREAPMERPVFYCPSCQSPPP